jgi:hypothetical protein
LSQTPEEIVEDLKTSETFDLVSVLTDVSYPSEDVKVYLNGAKAHELNTLEAELEVLERSSEAAGNDGGIAESPEKQEFDAQIEVLKERKKAVIEEIRKSALTFTLRGIAPEQWRIIGKTWRHKIKPASKSEDDIIDCENLRNVKINAELLSKCIVKVTNASGGVSNGAVTVEAAEKLYDTLLDSEYDRLFNTATNLTFANGLFHNAIAGDADFLSES